MIIFRIIYVACYNENFNYSQTIRIVYIYFRMRIPDCHFYRYIIFDKKYDVDVKRGAKAARVARNE